MSKCVGMPKATVAIPVFNSAATLECCLRSAAAQTLADIEILVADDASTDGGAAIAEALALQDRRIQVMRLPRNGGKARAMNRMVEAARGTWFAVLDADDSYHPERLAQLISEAERHGVEMAADNLNYLDAGIGRVVQTAFDPATPPRIVGKPDLAANADSFGAFDFGILKPVIRRDFLLAQHLRYHEDARLAEDFYYLMNFFVAGGRGWICNRPLYNWTMPFGSVSRQWTTTGSGAWRYDYRNALRANRHFMSEMQRRGEHGMVALLRTRERQYVSMVHYIDAQRHAAEHRFLAAAAAIACHPSTYRLLVGRVAGRLKRRLAATHDGDTRPAESMAR